jgi:hypothetical protein
MKVYVMTSGAIFGLLTIAHVWRVFEERHLAKDPFFVAATLVAALLALWALRVLRVATRA